MLEEKAFIQCTIRLYKGDPVFDSVHGSQMRTHKVTVVTWNMNEVLFHYG